MKFDDVQNGELQYSKKLLLFSSVIVFQTGPFKSVLTVNLPFQTFANIDYMIMIRRLADPTYDRNDCAGCQGSAGHRDDGELLLQTGHVARQRLLLHLRKWRGDKILSRIRFM